MKDEDMIGHPAGGSGGPVRGRILRRRIGALLAASLAAGPASAAPLLDAMKGNTLTCGMGVSMFVDASGTHARMIGYGIDPGTGIQEASIALDAKALTRPDRVDIAVPRVGGVDRLRYEATRAGSSPADAGASGIRLLVDDDTVGDDCAVERGMKPFVGTRFDFIREGLCGNDPAEPCIDALATMCGPSPDAACVTRSRPILDRISKAYVERQDRARGQGKPR